MNQNFKIKMLAFLATISGPAIAPCFAWQDVEPLDESQSNEIAIVRPLDVGPISTFGTIRAADPIPDVKDSVGLPPIVSGNAAPAPNVPPPIFIAPPVVRGKAVFPKPIPAPAMEPEMLQIPPIVVAGANDGFSVPANTPNSALPIPNAMPLSPLVPLFPIQQIAEETNNENPATTVGAARVPSDLILMEILNTEPTLVENELETTPTAEDVVPTQDTSPVNSPVDLQGEAVASKVQPILPATDSPGTEVYEIIETKVAPEVTETVAAEPQLFPKTFTEPTTSPKLAVDAGLAELTSEHLAETELKKIEKDRPNTASQIADAVLVVEKVDPNQGTPLEAISQAAKWNPRQAPEARSKAGFPIYAETKQEPTTEIKKFLPPIVSGQNLSVIDSTRKTFVPEIVQGESTDLNQTKDVNLDVIAPVQNSPALVTEATRAELPEIVQGSVLPPLSPVISPQSIPVPPSREIMESIPVLTAPPKSLAITEKETILPKTLELPEALPIAQPAPQPIAAKPYVTSPVNNQTTAPVTNRSAKSSSTPTYFNTLPGARPAITSAVEDCLGCSGSGCPECGVMGAATADYAGCQSCGSGGCFDSGTVASRFGNSGSMSSARKYFTFDAIYLNRYDGTIAISNFGGLNNFEDDLFGARVTIGRRQDAANGDELSYFGSANMSESAFHTDPSGRISIGFPSTGAFAIETTAFRNAVEQSQNKSTMFQSIEYNRNDWGWDVVRTFLGLRYIYIQDEYQISSQNLAGETGDFELSTQNNLLGGHLGYELFYDVGNRVSWSTIGKFGVYANPNRVKTKLNNAGAQFLDLKDTNTAFSGTIELGLNGHFKLGKQSRVRFGYNAFWLGEVASVADNIPVAINPTTGSDTSDSDDMFFHGLSLGVEIFR